MHDGVRWGSRSGRSVKKKYDQVDGLGAKNVEMLRANIRLAWMRSSHARKLVINRCKIWEDPDGMSECENKKCKRPRVIKIMVDHIRKCGDVLDPGYLLRVFCSSKHLQGLCKKCHDRKTRQEREEDRW